MTRAVKAPDVLPVDPAFRWTRETWGSGLRCAALGEVAQHVFTTRQLQLRGGPQGQPQAWRSAAAAVDVPLERVMRVRQVHGRTVRVIRAGATPLEAYADTPDADAIVSDVAGLALSVLVADCVPILLADRRGGVAAAVHAGWRGTAAGIVGATIDAMYREFRADPGAIVAAIGPSIRPCCYEVGEELREAFQREGHAAEDVARWFSTIETEDGQGSLRLDVAQSNRDQLHAAGVDAANIFDCGYCTKTFSDTFDSFRADGERAGRMAAIIVAG